jgi:hypothetical protein
MISDKLRALAGAIARADMTDPIEVQTLPLRLESKANAHVHWRRLAQKAAVQRFAAKKCLTFGLEPGGCRVVRLVRISPRELDSDNLAVSLKAVRDGVADALGVDDRDPRVVWLPDWERGEPRQHAVRVEVYR